VELGIRTFHPLRLDAAALDLHVTLADTLAERYNLHPELNGGVGQRDGEVHIVCQPEGAVGAD